MSRILIGGLMALIALAAALPADAQEAQDLYATLQVPGEATGYVSASLKMGTENTAGFFTVKDDILRLGNVNYKLEKNPAAGDNANVFSLRDANGGYVIFDRGNLAKSAEPAKDNQWFRLRFYSAVQRDEIENRRRAYQSMGDPAR